MDTSVSYFSVEGFPGRYFTCTRYGSLSEAACARNFHEAPEAVRRGRLEACIACAIGRHHAGQGDVPASTKGNPAPNVCVRCRRSGRSASARSIGRMRLVRTRTLCVSCYNREREVRIGANAKGAPPRKWAGLFHARIGLVRVGRVHPITSTTLVLDRSETMLTLLRLARNEQTDRNEPLAFCWLAAPTTHLLSVNINSTTSQTSTT